MIEFTRNTTNSRFISQLRLSCDFELTRNCVNSHIHTQPAIVMLSHICQTKREFWTLITKGPGHGSTKVVLQQLPEPTPQIANNRQELISNTLFCYCDKQGSNEGAISLSECSFSTLSRPERAFGPLCTKPYVEFTLKYMSTQLLLLLSTHVQQEDHFSTQILYGMLP